jgi:hypothetical protein
MKIFTLAASSEIAREVKIGNNVAFLAGSTAIKEIRDNTKFIQLHN